MHSGCRRIKYVQEPNYLIVARFVEGGYSEVYKGFPIGRWSGARRWNAVAIKVCRLEHNDTDSSDEEEEATSLSSFSRGFAPHNQPQTRDTISHEINLLKRLSPSKYTTKYFDSFQYESDFSDEIWIVMEHLAVDLQTLYNVGCRLSDIQIRAVGIQLLKALDYIHQKHVIHRDLKPANVLISTTGQVKLCDFGISQLLPELNSRITLKELLGTPEFMAPELFLVGGEYDKSVDVWAFGSLIYALRYPHEPLFEKNMQGIRIFPSRAWEAYRESNGEYFFEVFGYAGLDDNNAKVLKSRLKNGYFDLDIQYRDAEKKRISHKDFYTLIRKCLIPYPRNGPNNDITRADVLTRASEEELLAEDYFKGAPSQELIRRNLIKSIVSAYEVKQNEQQMRIRCLTTTSSF